MNNSIPARLENAGKRFGDVIALHDVDLSIAPGETLAILGPNGAGKTTAVRLLLGVLRPGTGTARIFGRDPSDASARMRIGTMLQLSGVPGALTVAEHIALFSTYYPHPLPLEETVKLAGLQGLEGRRAAHLSGGQRQRLFFALAICGDPDILILDEPTVGLDIEARTAIWDRIRALAGSGRSVLLTTHYLAEAQELADRVAIITHGALRAEESVAAMRERFGGTTVRMRTSLKCETAREIIGATNVRATSDGLEILTQDGDAVVRAIYARDPHSSIVDVVRGDLESAYLALVNSQGVAA